MGVCGTTGVRGLERYGTRYMIHIWFSLPANDKCIMARWGMHLSDFSTFAVVIWFLDCGSSIDFIIDGCKSSAMNDWIPIWWAVGVPHRHGLGGGRWNDTPAET